MAGGDGLFAIFTALVRHFFRRNRMSEQWQVNWVLLKHQKRSQNRNNTEKNK